LFRRLLTNIYDAFELMPDGTIRETGERTWGRSYAEELSPALASLLLEVWCNLPARDCNPCRRLILSDYRCTECRVKPHPTARGLVALERKLDAQRKDLETGDFQYWLADRVRRADGRKFQSKVLYEDYRDWVRSRPLTRPEKRAIRNTLLTQKRFGQCLRAAGYRYKRHSSGIFYIGLKLRKPSSVIVALNSENA
jgi:hypothetical protein